MIRMQALIQQYKVTDFDIPKATDNLETHIELTLSHLWYNSGKQWSKFCEVIAKEVEGEVVYST